MFMSVEDIEAVTPNLSPEEREEVLEGALAIAMHYAPCLRSETVPEHIAATAKAVIRNAVKYDVQVNEGAGLARQTEQLGPYGVSNYPLRANGTFFSPSQIELLMSLCNTSVPGVYSLPLDVPDTLSRW